MRLAESHSVPISPIVPTTPLLPNRTPVASGAPAAQPKERSGWAAPRPWLTLAPVVGALIALVALAVVPWIVSRRLADLRRDMAEATIRARRLIDDIESGLVLEAAARSAPALAAKYDGAVAMERAREAALDSLAPRLGREVAEDVAQLRFLTASRHASRGATSLPMVSLAEVVTVAARLDTALAAREAEQVARGAYLESWDVVLPAVLAPILLVTVVAVHRAGRRMAALADEAQRSRLALARAAEQKVALLRGLTHDLKNTLWAAGGYAQLLEEEIVGPLTPTQRNHVGRIGRLIRQAVGGVGDSLEIAQADAGVLPVRRERTDLRALLAEAAADYRAAANAARLALDVELADDLPAIETDPSLVSKIVGNLMSNAIKYTPAGGRVWLRVSVRPASWPLPAGTSVAVEVCDTGPGVPPAFREQIFDEFFRTPTARATAPGAGVGVAMSRRVARAIGGEITVDGEDGRGACFTLWLPVSASAEEHARPGVTPAVSGPPPN